MASGISRRYRNCVFVIWVTKFLNNSVTHWNIWVSRNSFRFLYKWVDKIDISLTYLKPSLLLEKAFLTYQQLQRGKYHQIIIAHFCWSFFGLAPLRGPFTPSFFYQLPFFEISIYLLPIKCTLTTVRLKSPFGSLQAFALSRFIFTKCYYWQIVGNTVLI